MIIKLFLKNADHEFFFFYYRSVQQVWIWSIQQNEKKKIRDTFGNQNTTDSSTFHKQPISSIL